MIWPQIVYALVMMVASYAISYYTAKRNRQSRKDAEVGHIDVPTSEEGRNIYVVFGTVLLKDANIIDYFDPKTEEIKG